MTISSAGFGQLFTHKHTMILISAGTLSHCTSPLQRWSTAAQSLKHMAGFENLKKKKSQWEGHKFSTWTENNARQIKKENVDLVSISK